MQFSTAPLLSPQRNGTPRDTFLALNPSIFCPIGQERDKGQGRWDGEAFKVFCLACCIFRDESNCGVEAGETSKPAADKSCQDYRIQVRP